MMTYFIKYAMMRGTEEDKRFSSFLLAQLGKGVLVANTILVGLYVSRFRTYRNSNLMRMHVPATLLGSYSAIAGTMPLFYAYVFDRAELSQRFALRDVEVY